MSAQALLSAASPRTITGVSRKRAGPNARRPPSSTKLASTTARSNGCDATASLALPAVGFDNGSKASASSHADSASPSSGFGVATMTCWRNGMATEPSSSNRASRFCSRNAAFESEFRNYSVAARVRTVTLKISRSRIWRRRMQSIASGPSGYYPVRSLPMRQ